MSEEQDLNEMERDELKAMAESLGVEVAPQSGAEKFRRAIRQKLGEPVEDEAPEQSAEPSAPPGEKRRTIRIAESETDRRPVFVGLNGREYVINRGEEVKVPEGVIEILEHAKVRTWDQDMNRSREVLRYPFQVLD